MGKRLKSQLLRAYEDVLISRFSSKFEKGHTDGYVLDIGQSFFMLARIDDSKKFDGFECRRIEDMRKIKVPAPYATFALEALRKQKQMIRKKPDVSLDSLPEILESANKIFPIVTIFTEELKPNCCWIGKVVELTPRHLTLHKIGPDAIWHDSPTKYRLSEITRVDFGGGYERALYLVGGNPSPMKGKAKQKHGKKAG